MKTPHPTSVKLLEAVLPKNGSEFSDWTNELYAVAQQMHAAVAKVQDRALALEALRRDADAAEEEPDVYAHFETVKQKVGTLIMFANEAQHAIDRLTDTSCKLDQAGLDMQHTLEFRGRRLVGETVPPRRRGGQ
jgi:chaperonin cofactor prefoldin